MLGPDRPVRLRLLEIPQGAARRRRRRARTAGLRVPAAARRRRDATIRSRRSTAASIALLVGARPRGPGMERADLLAANAGIFGPQGAAINAVAADDVRVVVVGNPANTNALIAAASAPDVPADRFTALTRLDHNRARGPAQRRPRRAARRDQRASRSGATTPRRSSRTSRTRLVRGDAGDRRARGSASAGRDAATCVARRRLHPARREARCGDHRGARIVVGRIRRATPRSSTCATSSAGTAGWTSAAVVSRGEYGVPEGLVCSFPVTSDGSGYRVVEGLPLDDRSPRAHRRLGRRTRRRARRRARPRSPVAAWRRWSSRSSGSIVVALATAVAPPLEHRRTARCSSRSGSA